MKTETTKKTLQTDKIGGDEAIFVRYAVAESGAYLAYVSIKTTSVTQKKGDLGNFNMCPT